MHWLDINYHYQNVFLQADFVRNVQVPLNTKQELNTSAHTKSTQPPKDFKYLSDKSRTVSYVSDKLPFKKQITHV